jgi:acyl-CoA dehydrogenase
VELTAVQTESEPFSLPPLHARIQAEAEEISTRFADRHREVRLHCLEQHEIHPELWAAAVEQGWPGLVIPSDRGGTEGGLLGLVVAMEALAASNLVVWMPVLTAAIAHAIAEVGPDPARAGWLDRVASGDAQFALAATEPECGHNLFRAQTTITRQNGHFVVDGVKAVTSGTDLADRVLVFGRSPRDDEGGPTGYTTVLIDPEAAGVERTELQMRGREGVRQFKLELNGVKAPLESLVGVEGQGLLVLWPFTHVERLLTSALCMGNARYCLDRAVARAKERTIFGKQPIGAEQAIQHPLAELHARLEAARLLVYRAAGRFDAAVDGLLVAGEANAVKVLTADLLFDSADHAVQTLGAEAWDENEGMLDLFLDARLARSGPISQELALNFVAQHVLGLPAHK